MECLFLSVLRTQQSVEWGFTWVVYCVIMHAEDVQVQQVVESLSDEVFIICNSELGLIRNMMTDCVLSVISRFPTK